MKHQHAEYIKAWAEDWGSVQFSTEPDEWKCSPFVSIFGYSAVKFRHTPKPEYRYVVAASDAMTAAARVVSHAHITRTPGSNIRITYDNGVAVAVEMITAGDGK